MAHGGWPSSFTLDALLDDALACAKYANYNHLGVNDTDRQTRVSEIVNRALEEWLEANPQLSRTTTTINVVSGTSGYNIPADLHGLAIAKVTNSDSGSDTFRDLLALDFLTPGDVAALPADWRNGETTADRPSHWALNDGATQIVLYPEPSASNTLVVHYRTEPTAITQANVASPTGTTISVVPTRFMRVVALRVAAEIVEPNNPGEAGALWALYRERLGEAQKRLIRVLAQFQPKQSDWPHRYGGVTITNLFRNFRRRI
jgi:hypothetical protein